MSARPIIIGVIVATATFTAGRMVPRAHHREQLAPAAAHESARPQAPARAHPPPPARTDVVVIGDRPMARAWVDAVARNPKAANRTRQTVTLALEGRRHLSSEIERCLTDEPFEGVLRLTFAVDVDSNADELVVNDARFVSVATGAAPIASTAAACLERHLAGHDVTRADDGPFLDGYAGPIDYVAAFAHANLGATTPP